MKYGQAFCMFWSLLARSLSESALPAIKEIKWLFSSRQWFSLVYSVLNYMIKIKDWTNNLLTYTQCWKYKRDSLNVQLVPQGG